MSSNELFTWIILTILEITLLYPLVSWLIKLKWFSESDYEFSQKNSQKLNRRNKRFN